MRALLLISLLLGADPHDHRTRENRRAGERGPGVSLPFFSAFDVSGAGTSGPCSTTAPTGAKGEVLTFTRASNGTCTKTASGGLATTGIANGDLVVLSSNVARVEYDSNGVLGLLVEAASTNKLLRSEEFDNASWTKEQDSAPRAPVVTANAATAPDGTATADRAQFPATSGAQYSDAYQTFNAAALGDATTCSAYVRGNGTADTTDICRFDGASWACSACAYVSDSWTRCTTTDAAGATGVTRYCKIGNNSNQNGGVARNTADIFVWGFQGEAPGAYATSYIPTAGVAVARAAEATSFASVDTTGLVSAGSTAGTVTVPWTSGVGSVTWANSSGRYLHFNGVSARTFDGTTEPAIAHGFTGLATKRFAASWTGSALTVFNVTAGTSTAGAFDGTMASGTLSVGYSSTNAQIDGIVTRVCIDPDPARCR